MSSSIGVLLHQEPDAFVNMMIGKRWLPHSGTILPDRHLYTRPTEDQRAPVHIDGGDTELRLNKTHDIRALLLEVDLLITRALQAANGGNLVALMGYLYILHEALSVDDAAILTRIMSVDETGAPSAMVDDLVKLFQIVVVDPAMSDSQQEQCAGGDIGILSAVATELMDCFSYFAENTSVPNVKDVFGQRLLPDLVLVLRRTIVDAHPDFGIGSVTFQRSTLELTKGFVKKSKPNKEILCKHIEVMGQILMEMTDFIVQLQSTEIMYRLTKHKPRILRRPRFHEVTKISNEIVTTIENLPNDNTLLKCIIAMLEELNTTQTDHLRKEGALRGIIPYECETVELAKRALVSKPCKVYFHVSHLVVVYPECSGEHIAIPYGEISSVKLSKDRKISFGLYRIRKKLVEQLLTSMQNDRGVGQVSVTARLESEPTFSFRCTPQVIQRLKDNAAYKPIEQWKQKLREKEQRRQIHMLAGAGRSVVPQSRPVSRPVSVAPVTLQQQQPHYEHQSQPRQYAPPQQHQYQPQPQAAIQQQQDGFEVPRAGSKRDRHRMEGENVDHYSQEVQQIQQHQQHQVAQQQQMPVPQPQQQMHPQSRQRPQDGVSSMQPQPLTQEEQQVFGHHPVQRSGSHLVGSGHGISLRQQLELERQHPQPQQPQGGAPEQVYAANTSLNISAIQRQSHADSTTVEERNMNTHSGGKMPGQNSGPTLSTLYANEMAVAGPDGTVDADSFAMANSSLMMGDSMGGDPNESDEEALAKLKAMISGNLNHQRQSNTALLENAMGQFQQYIDDSKRENRRDRDDYDQLVLTELQELRKQVDEYCAIYIESAKDLNHGLAELQTFAGTITDNMDLLEGKDPNRDRNEEEDDQAPVYDPEVAISTLGQLAHQTEAEELHRIKQMVEAEMGRMQEAYNAHISSVNPLKFLSSYIKQKMGGMVA